MPKGVLHSKKSQPNISFTIEQIKFPFYSMLGVPFKKMPTRLTHLELTKYYMYIYAYIFFVLCLKDYDWVKVSEQSLHVNYYVSHIVINVPTFLTYFCVCFVMQKE